MHLFSKHTTHQSVKLQYGSAVSGVPQYVPKPPNDTETIFGPITGTVPAQLSPKLRIFCCVP